MDLFIISLLNVIMTGEWSNISSRLDSQLMYLEEKPLTAQKSSKSGILFLWTVGRLVNRYVIKSQVLHNLQQFTLFR